MSWRSTSTSGEAARAFITLTSVWPPASARAPSCAESRPTASSTFFGRTYSTSASSTAPFSYTRRMAAARKVAILGGGKIGESLLAGLLSSGWRSADEVVVTGRREERIAELAERYGVPVTLANAEAVDGAGLIVVAVKPQDIEALLVDLSGRITTEQTVLSV